MTSGYRRMVLTAMATCMLALTAIPAFAQSSSLVSGRSLLASVKFDAAAAPSQPSTPTLAPRLNAGAVRFVPQDERGGIGIGALAGIIRTSLTGEDVDEFFETSTGTMFGLWIGGNTDGLIGFTGEFNYLIRNQNVDADGDGDIDDKFSRPGFSIPAVFHVNFGPDDRSKGLIYIVLGPVFTFTLKQEIKIDGEGEAIDVGDEFNGADIGFLGGAGFEIFRIAVEVRHNWGLRSITSEGSVDKIKTKSWEFLVKFRFN
jgi:hypothetical protein